VESKVKGFGLDIGMVWPSCGGIVKVGSLGI
jgi:hypothetical protein